MRLLLCSDPLTPRVPDSAFETEVAAIYRLDLPYELVDLEALLAGSVERSVRRIGETAGELLYRGWMIPVGCYAELAQAIETRGASLFTTPDAYASAHHLPLAYAAVEAITPKTVWVDGTGAIDFTRVHDALRGFRDRPVIVKDFVKSRKHEWAEACFIPSASDRSAVERVVSRFVELQGEDLAGGLVFREFIELEQVGTHPQSGLALGREYRLFFLDGRLMIGGRYWDEADYSDEYPAEQFERLASRIPSRFFSMDIAKTKGGDWIVMEIGDGQVSGLPEAIDPREFYSRLAGRIG